MQFVPESESCTQMDVLVRDRGMAAQIFGGQKRMSAIAVMDVSSAETLHQRMLVLAEQGRQEWALLCPPSSQVGHYQIMRLLHAWDPLLTSQGWESNI